jgi:hypothetical protein
MTRVQKVLLALACCFVLVLLPVSTALAQEGLLKGAQKGIEKGAEGVKKGAETAVEKTKEGAKAVGREAKDLVTDDDPDTDKDETTTERMKPGQTQSGTPVQGTTGATTKRSPSGTTSEGTRSTGATGTTETTETGERNLPGTAGELPLLALAGALALLGARALKVGRRTD